MLKVNAADRTGQTMGYTLVKRLVFDLASLAFGLIVIPLLLHGLDRYNRLPTPYPR